VGEHPPAGLSTKHPEANLMELFLKPPAETYDDYGETPISSVIRSVERLTSGAKLIKE
jgi:hypothetical protein